MSQPLYRDSPLTTQASIRLLEVTANCLAYDKPSYKLSYSLTVFEIQNIPPYSALSYTWGNPLPSEGSDDDVPWLKESYSIDCNGYSVGITPNLFEGLISLAKLDSMATSGLTLFASIKKPLQSEILRSL